MEDMLNLRIAGVDGEPIAVERWNELIQVDPELERIEFAEGRNPMTGAQMRIPYAEPAAVWTAHPEGLIGPPFVFAYQDGAITAVFSDQPFAAKGEEIATRLGARLHQTPD